MSLVAIVFGSTVGAVNFNDYKVHFTSVDLTPLAQDVGALLGAGTFRSGRSLSFPGVNLEIEDVILGGGTSTWVSHQGVNFPYARAEISLPVNGLAVQVRGSMTYADLSVLGVGAKYSWGGFSSGPEASGLGVALAATHHLMSFGSGADQLNVSVASFNVIASYCFSAVAVEPYVGVGWDFSSLTARLAGTDMPVSATGTRFALGLNVPLFPSFYGTGEIGWSHQQMMYGLKMGVKIP